VIEEDDSIEKEIDEIKRYEVSFLPKYGLT
jgi:hypothetical protein